jgi:hypothetical protein
MSADDAEDAAQGGSASQGGSAAQEPAGERGQDRDTDVVPEAWEAVEQLFTMAPHLRAERANVLGDTRVGGDVVGGDKHVHVHTEGRSRLRPLGPVPAEELHRLERTFAPTRRYDEACAKLADARVLVLRGRAGTGRRTAALRMLRQIGGRGDEVIALDPGTEPAEFADHLRPGAAHLVVDPLTGTDRPLRDVHLHAVRQRIADSGGLFIAVTSTDTVVDGAATADWAPPPAADVVRAHLTALLEAGATGASTRDDSEQGQRRVRDRARAECARLLDLAETRNYLRERPTPGEAADFARLLAAHAAGRIGTDALEGYGRSSAEALADTWFSGSGPELRDKAFLISLAAFDGSPYPLVAELGDVLFRNMQSVEQPDGPGGHPVFATSRGARLALARAHERDQQTETPWGKLPEKVVAFENSGAWAAVLEHVWMSHPAARLPMLGWLDTLSYDSRAVVRLRGAVAAGVLACADFGYAFDRLIARWASSDRLMERQLAAWSLYTAAARGMDVVVRRLLSDWSRQGSQGRRWTAVRTYALLGDASAATALREIARVASTGATPDQALWSALVQTVETLLQEPAQNESLDALQQWGRAGGRLRQLAGEGFLRAAGRHSYQPVAGCSGPRLLWSADRDAVVGEQITALWRQVLDDRELRRDALQVLGSWLRAAREPAVEAAVARLLPGLVITANDRDRLDHLLRKLRDEDSSSGAAERLRAGLPSVSAPER